MPDELIVICTPQQFADLVNTVRVQYSARTPGQITREFQTKVMGVNSVAAQIALFPPDGASGSCTIIAKARADGKTIVTANSYVGDWSRYESAWQILTEQLESLGWIGEAPEPAQKQVSGDRKFYDWAFVEIEFRGRDPKNVFDDWLQLIEGLDVFDMDASEVTRRFNNFQSAMSTRRKRLND